MTLSLASLRALALGAAVFLCCNCSAPISIRTAKPAAPAGTVLKGIATANLLDAIQNAYGAINRGDDSAIPAYNYSVARLIEEVELSGADPWNSSLPVSGPVGLRSLNGRSPRGTDPLHDQLIPTDSFHFKGKYSHRRALAPGIGAPLVAVTSYEGLGHKEARTKVPLRNLTALVRFSGTTATLELIDPYQVERVAVGGRSHPLAADYGAAVMLGLSKSRIDTLGLVRLLHPSRYDDTAHLNFLQPYDRERIPVLFVHGLQDTPASFSPMYFSLLEDPEIRKRYQFWVFSYPSGYPYFYSASLLRRELDHVDRDFPDHPDLVVIGHSMGGIISRLMVTEAGDTIWRKAFGHPPETTPLTGKSRDLLIEALVFRSREEINRAVFISSPHRGSILASNWIGRIGSRLVRLPAFVADARNALVSVASVDIAGLVMSRAPNSIDTLSPDNLFVREINKIPIDPGLPYHSIIGDRGKGDTPDSSDGVVPYWSSHLDGAESERIVPSGHAAHQNPEAIEEVRRILRLHLTQQR